MEGFVECAPVWIIQLALYQGVYSFHSNIHVAYEIILQFSAFTLHPLLLWFLHLGFADSTAILSTGPGFTP